MQALADQVCLSCASNWGNAAAHQGLAHFCCRSGEEPQSWRHSATAPPHLPLLIRVGCQEHKTAGYQCLAHLCCCSGEATKSSLRGTTRARDWSHRGMLLLCTMR